jgi:hypothetical protein
VPAEHVDRSSLAKDRVRDLRPELPTIADEQLREVVTELCVKRVQQTIEIATSPSDGEHEFRVEASDDLPNRLDRHPVDLTALEQRDLSLAQPDATTQIALAQAETLAKRTPEAPDPEVVHGISFDGRAHLPLI